MVAETENLETLKGLPKFDGNDLKRVGRILVCCIAGVQGGLVTLDS